MKRRIDKDFLPYSALIALDALASLVSVSRRQRELTQADLAAMTELSLSTIIKIEQGSPSVQIGHWLKVLAVFDHTDKLVLLAQPERDPDGVKLMMQKLPMRIRARK